MDNRNLQAADRALVAASGTAACNCSTSRTQGLAVSSVPNVVTAPCRGHCTGVAALAYCDRVRAGDQSNDQALLEIAGASGRQHLLLTLLGDYWYPRFDPLPS